MALELTSHSTTSHGDSIESAPKGAPVKSPVGYFGYSIAISTLFVLLIVLHLAWPGLQIDTLTVLMAILAVLPWFGRLIESFEAPGGWKFKYREFRDELKSDIKGISSELKYLRFMFSNFLSTWEISHLKNLMKEEFIFNRSDSFDQELRRLRALGFIEPIGPDKGIRSMNADPSRDVRKHFRISDRGENYLRLLEGMDKDLREKG